MKNKIYHIDFVELTIKRGYLKGDLEKIRKFNKVFIECYGIKTEIKGEDIYIDRKTAEDKLKLYILKKEFKNSKFKNKRNFCYYCGKSLIKSEATIDHKDPISKAPERKFDKTNFVIACKCCNAEKDNKDFCVVNKERNINIKSQIRKQNKTKIKTEKIGRTLSRDVDNALELARKDSNVWDVNLFFAGKDIFGACN